MVIRSIPFLTNQTIFVFANKTKENCNGFTGYVHWLCQFTNSKYGTLRYGTWKLHSNNKREKESEWEKRICSMFGSMLIFEGKILSYFFLPKYPISILRRAKQKIMRKMKPKKVLHFSSSIKFNSEIILPNILANGGCTCVCELDHCRQLCFG